MYGTWSTWVYLEKLPVRWVVSIASFSLLAVAISAPAGAASRCCEAASRCEVPT
jgi:hypothetical protein